MECSDTALAPVGRDGVGAALVALEIDDVGLGISLSYTEFRYHVGQSYGPSNVLLL